MTRESIYFGYAMVIGAIGGVVTTFFGGWSHPMTILCICMAIDYLSGLAVAGIFHASPKTESGGLDSNVGLKGLVRKVAILMLVVIANFIDALLAVEYIRDATVIALTVNELLSILENFALMGAPIPEILLRSIDILHKKTEPKEEDENPANTITWDEFQAVKQAIDDDSGKITFKATKSKKGDKAND